MLNEQTVKQFAYMTGLAVDQFTMTWRTDPGRAFVDVVVSDNEIEPVMAKLTSRVTTETPHRYHYYLWFRDKRARKIFKPIIEMLTGLADQGDIFLWIHGEEIEQGDLFNVTA